MRIERGTLSRRGFLESSMGTLAVAGLPLWYAREVHGAASDAEQRAGLGEVRRGGALENKNAIRCFGVAVARGVLQPEAAHRPRRQNHHAGHRHHAIHTGRLRHGNGGYHRLGAVALGKQRRERNKKQQGAHNL